MIPVSPPAPGSAADLRTLYTIAYGPGNAYPQPRPAASLGKFSSSTPWAGGAYNDLFPTVSAVAPVAASGSCAITGGVPSSTGPFYRALYVTNAHPNDDLEDVRLYFGAAGEVAVGVDPVGTTGLAYDQPQGGHVVDGLTPPDGVTFSVPTDYAGGAQVGYLPAGTGRMVWLRFAPGAATDAVNREVALILQASSDPADATVRRILWQDERAVPATPVCCDEPSYYPFLRVSVDYLTEGNGRVTWEIDPTFSATGEHLYQLQASHSGVRTADDWVDVGAPMVGVGWLYDPDKRMYGMSTTLNYRVVLVADGVTYVSMPAPPYGVLSAADWATAREIIRKERLRLRVLAGSSGYLLKAKRYGVVCSCVDPVSGEVQNSACLESYGLKFVGGYHQAVACWLGEPPIGSSRETVSYDPPRGTVRYVEGWWRMVADLPVVQQDAWVAAGADERYYVHDVKEVAVIRGVPLVYDVLLKLAPRSDVLYKFPISPAAAPPGCAGPSEGGPPGSPGNPLPPLLIGFKSC